MVDPQQEIPLFGLVTQIPSQQIKIPCSSLLLAVKVSFRRDFNSRKLQWTILYLSVFKTFFENVLLQTKKCPKSNKPSNQYLPGPPQGVTQQDCGLTLILQNRTRRPCLLCTLTPILMEKFNRQVAQSYLRLSYDRKHKLAL